jgi:RHS repeat-associated protein
MKIRSLLFLAITFLFVNCVYAQNPSNKKTNKSSKSAKFANVSHSNKIQSSDFDYYENGLLKKDLTKGILQINYVVVFPPRTRPINPMFENSSESRASEIILTNNRKITYEYLADGTKLGKKLYVNNQVVKEYIYEEDETYEVLPNGEEKLVEMRMDEGRLVPHPTKPNEMIYEYDIKDHLNNTRVTFTENPTNPNLPPVIVQAKNYDPFGKELKGISTYDSTIAGYPNLYRFNGKQFENDFDIGLYDYGSRLYDPRLGRWQSPDPLAPMFPNWSPFAFSFDNPVNFIDHDGRLPWPVTVRSFISTPSVGGGLFYGDGRGPSFSGTSRVYSNFIVDPARGSISNPSSRSDPTIFFPTNTRKTGSPTASISDQRNSEGVTSFKFSHSGKDPITPSLTTPALDVHAGLSFNEDLKKGVLTVSGTFSGDKFPSTEAFITDQSGKNKVFLGAQMENGGVSDLFGDNNKPLFNVNMQVNFDKNGNFTGVTQGGTNYSVSDWNKRVQEGFKK